MPVHLFTYGTLMLPEVWEAVVSHRYMSQIAFLSNHQRFTVRNEVYPGLRYLNGCTVQGVVYFDISSDDLHRLDAFEGEAYQRSEVRLVVDSNKNITAETYLVKNEYLGILSKEVWTTELLNKGGLARFLEGYQGWT